MPPPPRGDVQVSLTTFAKLVNIGTSYVNSTCIDWTDWNSAQERPAVRRVHSALQGLLGRAIHAHGQQVAAMALAVSSSRVAPLPPPRYLPAALIPVIFVPVSCIPIALRPVSVVIISMVATSLPPGRYRDRVAPAASPLAAATSTVAPAAAVAAGRFVDAGNGTTPGHLIHSAWDGCVEDRNRTYSGSTVNPTRVHSASFGDQQPISPPPMTTIAPSHRCYRFPPPGPPPNGRHSAPRSSDDRPRLNQSDHRLGAWLADAHQRPPYNAPRAPVQHLEYIILVCDGLNTQDRWFGDGWDGIHPGGYAHGQTCTNAKAAGIVIYTIFVDLGGTQGNSTVLQNCATDSSKYYDLTTSNARS